MVYVLLYPIYSKYYKIYIRLILSELKIVDSIYLFLDLGLGISIISHVILSHIYITYYNHIIMCYIEEYKRF